MTPLDPATLITVTMQAQDWNVVMGLLAEVPAPYRVSAPIIAKLTGQLQAGAADMQRPDKPNGEDAHAPH